MKTIELIDKLKRCPEGADIFFDTLNGGLVDVEHVNIISVEKAHRCGREVETAAVILSDVSPLNDASDKMPR